MKFRPKINTILFIISLFCSGYLFAYPNYSFKHYNINNGLSQNTVHSILQDNLGFMWFGTKDGLNRFDGKSFKILKSSPENVLKDNVFHRILQDKNNNIWAGTDEGVCIYYPQIEKFEHFDLITTEGLTTDGIVSDLLLDNDGDIWIAVEEKGVFHYSITAKTLTHYAVPSLPGGMMMISLCEGKDKDIWAFPYNLPFVNINKETHKISTFQLEDEPNLLHELGEVWKVENDQYNQLLVASSTKGLLSINTVNKTHKILLGKDDFGQEIFVRSFERIDPKTIWVGSESGLYIYDSETGKATNLKHNKSIPTSISDNAIYSIFKDKEGGIWVGSYFGGVDYYSGFYNRFKSYFPIYGVNNMRGSRVREFSPAPDGKIWIGTEDDGLNLFDPQTEEFLPLPTPFKSIYHNIHALCSDGDYFWVGTFAHGINRYNLKTGEFITYLNLDKSGIIHGNANYAIFEDRQISAFTIFKDRQNTLWFGNLVGAHTYNYQTNTFESVDELKDAYVQDIYEDTNGEVWISTFSKGLYNYNPENKKWKTYLNSSNSQNKNYNKLNSVFEDSQKRLWVATSGGGLYLFDRERDSITVYNSLNGLPNDVVYQIQEDNQGNLWLSTNGGLSLFNPTTKKIKNYTTDNGLKTNQFNYKSSYKAPDGTLYFGSIDGFVRFNPSDFADRAINLPIVFTELEINNSVITPQSKSSPLSKSILYTDTLTLPYSRNSFKLHFSVLDNQNLNSGRFKYKLQGFDEDWIEMRDKQPIVYSNLSPGKYKLTIILENESETDSPESFKTLYVFIRPPFWFSTWALILYVCLIIGGLVGLNFYLKKVENRRRKNQLRKIEQEKERELYQSKIDFFTNVAHEIRTPLSLIKGPLDHILITEKPSKNVLDNLKVMSRNTDRLLDLTNQLLDFRKTESAAYMINPQIYNVTELLKETITQFEPLIKQQNLNFILELPDDDVYARFDKEAFTKIITNLLSNAVKYCNSFIHLKLYISQREGEKVFHLLLENDGDTIPTQFKEDIFKPFVHFDRKDEKKVPGTGIGLALSRSLAELHNGSLSFENIEDLNCFHLILPLGDVDEKITTATEVATSESNVKEDRNGKKQALQYTVLLVEDDLELLEFEKKCLASEYRVLTAENAEKALEILKDETVNLIVSDVMMPGMDGFEFTRLLKSNIEYSHIPVIILTAKVTVQAKVEGLETGADAYIEKPFSVEVLLAQVSNLLQGREKLRDTFLKHPFIGASSVTFTKSDEEFIQKLHSIVHDNIDKSDFIVEDMAEQFNMSRASFYRKIKGILDLTPNEYMRVERLKKAAQLLKEKKYKVNEICYMVGFNSPSYFTKCFQQQFGILPKEFE